MRNLCTISLCFFISIVFAQQYKSVDFKTGNIKINVNPSNKTVKGMVSYSFDVLKSVDSIYLDARKLNVQDIFLNNNPVDFKYLENKIIIHNTFEVSKSNEVLITYDCSPTKAMYFLNRKDKQQVWTQGQGKNNSHWVPSFENVNQKVIFSIAVETPSKYKVIANGTFIGKTLTNNNNQKWMFKMAKPMSSYLLALVIGEYKKITEYSNTNIPLEFYYYPEDSLRLEPSYRYSKQMFDFLEQEIGIPYPWEVYKQAPVHDFLYSGMENTSFTIFSDAFMVDEIGFNDNNYVNVNAHELAHQWFGNMVTAKTGEHHWLQEGFATYYALLAEREVFGDNYFHFKWLEYAQLLTQQDIDKAGTSLLNPKSSSLTFYQRGAWVLYALRHKVGDKVFKTAVKNYLEKHQFKSVKTKDFISEIERLYGKSLQTFYNQWITSETFPIEPAIRLLQKQSPKVEEYLMVDCETVNSKCAEQLRYYVSDKAKAKLITQIPSLINKNTFNNGLEVRQAIAKNLRLVPKSLKNEYETLLNDASYITIENALYNLWTSFPEDRAKYLAKTREIDGLKDKNVRLLWIVLNLNTPHYESESKFDLYTELVNYTNENYNYTLRMNAFKYLKLIKSCNDVCKKNLDNATNHHNWRMKKFARQYKEELTK